MIIARETTESHHVFPELSCDSDVLHVYFYMTIKFFFSDRITQYRSPRTIIITYITNGIRHE